LIMESGSAKIIKLGAHQFIDCTGDGVLASIAGASFHYGRESRDEFKETLAPLKADNHTMGSTVLYEAVDTGRKSTFEPPEWAHIYEHADDFLPDRNPISFYENKFGGYWWLQVGGQKYDQSKDNDAIRTELLSHIYGVWDYVKNRSDKREKLLNYRLDWIGSVIGKRESRRIMGDVVLTEGDCRSDRKWEDAVLTAGWFIDLHTQGGINNREQAAELSHVDEVYANYTLVSPFTIPLRCLYSRDIDNLWMAGRDISVSHCALGPVRVQNICANMGQAVGTAAAEIIKTGETPREAVFSDTIGEIQQILLREDVRILNVINKDPDDFARNADFIVSSESPLCLDRVQGFIDLSLPRAQILPLNTPSLDWITLIMKNVAKQKLRIRYCLERVMNIWDDVTRPCLYSGVAFVEADYEGPVRLNFSYTLPDQGAYRISLRCESPLSSSLFLAKSEFQPPGTLAQYLFESEGGSEKKNRKNPLFGKEFMCIPPFSRWNQYRRSGFSHCLYVEPKQFPYGAQSLSYPKNHPEIMPNLWIADPKDELPFAILKFKKIRVFSRVDLYFDTNLNRSPDSTEYPQRSVSKSFAFLYMMVPGVLCSKQKII
jgi:hypothetical protein